MPETRRDRWGRYLIVPPEGGKPVGYTRATTVAKSLDDGGGLIPWKATLAMTGMMRRPGLRGRFEALLSQHPDTGPWYGGEEAKKESKKLVEECAEAGGSSDRADQGTALHAIVEQINKGVTPLISQDSTRADLDAYRTTLDAHGITFDDSLIECVLVLDEHRVAGTSDMGKAHVPTMPKPLVADLKTGTDLKYSWQAISIQLAIYAHADAVYQQGEAADGSQDQRLSSPGVSLEHGLVIHLPAGEARCELWLVDLVAGWEAFQHSMYARAWRSRKDLATPLGAVALEPALRASHIALGVAVPDFDAPQVPTGTTPTPAGGAAVSPAAAPDFDAPDRPPAVAAAGPVLPPGPAAPPDFDAPAAIPTAASTPPAPAPTVPAATSPREQAAALPGAAAGTRPDEGGDADPDAVELLAARHGALPVEQRQWWARLIKEAAGAVVPFHMKDTRTVRRFEIARGLVTLAEGDATDDELVRALAAVALDSDAPLFPAVTVGHAVGALDHEAAATFAHLADELIAGRLAGAIDPDGTFRLRAIAAT